MSDGLIEAKAGSAGSGAAAATRSFGADLSAIRALSRILPGPLPVSVNAIRVAAARQFFVRDLTSSGAIGAELKLAPSS